MIIRNLTLALAVSAIGAAQSVDFGLQAQFTLPAADLTEQVGSGSAVGLGAQIRWDLSRGHAVALKADRTEFSGSRSFDVYYQGYYGPLEVDSKQTLLSVGVDYNYYFSRKVGQGFYLGGGLGFLQKDESYTPPRGLSLHPNPDQTKTRLYFDMNLGVAVNRHVNLFMRTIAFGDERQEDTWSSGSGEYRQNYSLSATFAFGAEFHF